MIWRLPSSDHWLESRTGVVRRLKDLVVHGVGARKEAELQDADADRDDQRIAWVTCIAVLNENLPSSHSLFSTQIFRKDDAGEWRLVHYQANPITVGL